MTHLLCGSHYCGVVTAVGVRGGLGGLFIFLTLPHGMRVDSCEDTNLALLRPLRRDLEASDPSDSTTPSKRPRIFSTGFMRSLRASSVSPANRDALLARPASGAAKRRGPCEPPGTRVLDRAGCWVAWRPVRRICPRTCVRSQPRSGLSPCRVGWEARMPLSGMALAPSVEREGQQRRPRTR